MEIVYLSHPEVTRLMEMFSEADLSFRSVRVCIDGGFKISVNQGMWTPPMGRKSE